MWKRTQTGRHTGATASQACKVNINIP